jgi:hypothetical protein
MEVEEAKYVRVNPSPTEEDARNFSRTFYITKKLLIPVLLKHLNDNHFYIRAGCYSTFLFLVERRISLPNGHLIIRKPKMLAKRFEWERESWWSCQDQQQKLLAWWEDNGESILSYSDPGLYEATGPLSKAP